MADGTSNPAQPPPHIYRPIPRRAFDANVQSDAADSPTHAFTQATPPSSHESRRSSDFLAQLNARLLRTYDSRNDDPEDHDIETEKPPPRNRSFLNMTSSTLFGIYDDVGPGTTGDRSTIETPWGTGAETPAHPGTGPRVWETGMGSPDAGVNLKKQARRGPTSSKMEIHRKDHAAKHPRQGLRKYAIMIGKLAALYLFGAIYGLIVSHLHESRQLAAVHVEGVNRKSKLFLASWGLFGVTLGSLLPYVDLLWDTKRIGAQAHDKDSEKSESPVSEQINDVVRSVCAFVGIAFAIVSSHHLLCIGHTLTRHSAASRGNLLCS